MTNSSSRFCRTPISALHRQLPRRQVRSDLIIYSAIGRLAQRRWYGHYPCSSLGDASILMGSVRRDKCRDDPDPTMGYDRDLDKTFRVGFRLILSSRRRCDLEIVHRFHNVWEFWVYNVVFGLFQAPYYAFAQTMMAELTPPGFDNMVRITVLPCENISLILSGGNASSSVFTDCRTPHRR